MKRLLVIALLLLPACTPAIPSVTPQVVSVYTTAAAQPWLADLYDCAGSAAVLLLVADPQEAEISLRLGEPLLLATPAYEITREEIVVVVNQGNSITNLRRAEVFGLFTGQIRNWQEIGGGDAMVQVWVYGVGEDIQQIFNSSVLGGTSVFSLAWLATSPREMTSGIADDIHAVGLLPRTLVDETIKSVYSIASIPVLAVSRSEPSGVIKELLTCVQR